MVDSGNPTTPNPDRLELTTIMGSLHALRPREWQVRAMKGTMNFPRLGRAHILDEAAALKYVKEKSDIHVLTLYGCLDDNDANYLVTNYVNGVSTNSLTGDKGEIVKKELESHVQTLHSLLTPKLAGVSGHVVPPYEAMQKMFRDDWDLIPSLTDDRLVALKGENDGTEMLVDFLKKHLV
ncbi:hypothetical protein K432DRAFT_390881 [Lepidopterella palustris CBS 459.81]|uniref:Uncharacterized protein n=1 Tax=Lepidopterella palustris CBS 459.81 TaxID=1314670 RepID=A0A8E2JHQ0_9PEZI|nr:hypothetical protein K432DRAFT_390881 [Lepidopterella palustris CBS 459.81]